LKVDVSACPLPLPLLATLSPEPVQPACHPACQPVIRQADILAQDPVDPGGGRAETDRLPLPAATYLKNPLQMVVTPEPVPVTELGNDGLVVAPRANKASVNAGRWFGVPDLPPESFDSVRHVSGAFGCTGIEHLLLLMQKIVRYGDNIPNHVLSGPFRCFRSG